MKYLILSFFVLLLFVSCNISYPSGIIAEYTFNGNLNDYKLAEVAKHHGQIDFEQTGNVKGLKLTKTKEYNYLELPNIDLNTNEYTISLFIKITSLSGINSILFFGEPDRFLQESGLWLYTKDNRIAVSSGNQYLTNNNYKKTETENSIFTSSFALEENTFYYLSVAYKDSVLTLYVDAKIYAIYPDVTMLSLRDRTALLGVANPLSKELGHQFVGTMDELKLFNKALTQDQISLLYKSYKSN
jgi:hypothetical protein